MGLTKQNHTIEKLGITLPKAYAKIVNIQVDKNGEAYATFAIQQSREEIGTLRALDQINIDMRIDKTAPIFEQLYIKAKEEQFVGWDDDIVEENYASDEETVIEEE